MADARRAAPARLMEDAGGVLRLRGVLTGDDCLRHAADAERLDFEALLRRLMQGELRAHGERRLGPRLLCNLDRCWLRRQAPPPRHAPHSWHQDGALGADFNAAEPQALLPMLTCWIALTPCGIDAPGLQWVAEALPRLLTPPELPEARVAERFAAAPWHQPELAPGDALLFDGATLHRTHVMPTMTRERTSVELRLFPADALPARLLGDRFVDI